MSRPTIVFATATLVIATGVYVLITATTPLTPVQALGSGVAFLLGWMGLAYAGSEALRAMLRRRRARLASNERAADRAAAVVRRYSHYGSAREPALSRLERQEESLSDVQERASAATLASMPSTRATSATRNSAN